MPGTKICGKCGAKTAIDDMTYSVDGKKLVCQTCLNKEKGIYTATGVPPAPKPAPKPEMVNYHCNNCQFNFSRKKGIDVRNCPYCAKESVSVMK
jgi:DNA-directed RNA polymerase subunit RPC12/RpoP